MICVGNHLRDWLMTGGEKQADGSRHGNTLVVLPQRFIERLLEHLGLRRIRNDPNIKGDAGRNKTVGSQIRKQGPPYSAWPTKEGATFSIEHLLCKPFFFFLKKNISLF